MSLPVKNVENTLMLAEITKVVVFAKVTSQFVSIQMVFITIRTERVSFVWSIIWVPPTLVQSQMLAVIGFSFMAKYLKEMFTSVY